jgi:hypothetical protein
MRTKFKPKMYAEILYEITKDVPEVDLPEMIKSFIKSFGSKFPSDTNWKKIIESFRGVYNEKENIVEAHVTLRSRITSEEKKEVVDFLKGVYPDKHITILDHIDERVLGGIKIQVEDRLFDFTVLNSLKKLEKELIHK